MGAHAAAALAAGKADAGTAAAAAAPAAPRAAAGRGNGFTGGLPALPLAAALSTRKGLPLAGGGAPAAPLALSLGFTNGLAFFLTSPRGTAGAMAPGALQRGPAPLACTAPAGSTAHSCQMVLCNRQKTCPPSAADRSVSKALTSSPYDAPLLICTAPAWQQLCAQHLPSAPARTCQVVLANVLWRLGRDSKLLLLQRASRCLKLQEVRNSCTHAELAGRTVTPRLPHVPASSCSSRFSQPPRVPNFFLDTLTAARPECQPKVLLHRYMSAWYSQLHTICASKQ